MAKRSEANRQRRARQNRAQRAALEARTSGAQVKKPSRIAPTTADRLKDTPRETARAGSQDPTEAPAPGEGAKKAKPKRERPPRPGDRPVDIETLEGSWFSKVVRVPGGVQVLMGFAMTLVVTGMVALTDTFPSQADMDNDVENAEPVRTIFEALGTGRATVILAIPVVLFLAAAAFSLHKHRRRVWIVCAVLLTAYFALTAQTLYLFVVGFLLWAVMRASRIEGPNEPLFRRRAADPDDAGSAAEGDEPGADDEG